MSLWGKLFGTRKDGGLSQIAKNYQRALAYLDRCGPFDEAKLRETNRIAGGQLTEADIQRFLRSAPMMLPVNGKGGGMEAVKEEMRKSLAEGIKVFGSL